MTASQLPTRRLPNRRLLGAVLCGGRSSRMGRDKANLTLPNGMNFLDRAVSSLARVTDEVCLFGSQSYPASCRSLPDSNVGQGPMGGLLTALKLAKQERFEACVVTPVDTPFLGAADLTLLIETWQQNPAAPVCGKRETDGQRQPLIAVYPIVCYELIRDAAESNQRSLLKWLGDHDHLAVDLPARSCHNINTPHDLNAALPFFDDPDPRRIQDPPNS